MKKRAIFGGTFNPVHWGHLLIAEAARDQMALDQVLWVPSSTPPHRQHTPVVDISHRWRMVQEAIAPHPSFSLSPVDLHHCGPSYAIDTYLALQTAYPGSEWYWIIGLDAFQTLPRWYRRQELIPRCRWLVAPRPLSSSSPPAIDTAIASCQYVAQHCGEQGYPLTWHLLEMPLIHLSSSLVRQYCRDRRSIRYLVPEPVHAYLLQHPLYDTNGEGKNEE